MEAPSPEPQNTDCAPCLVTGTPKHGLRPESLRHTETLRDTQAHRDTLRVLPITRERRDTQQRQKLCVCCVFFSSSVPSAIQVVPRTDCAPCHGRPVTGPEPQNTDCAPRTAPHAMEAPFLEPQNTDCAPSHDANVIYTI